MTKIIIDGIDTELSILSNEETLTNNDVEFNGMLIAEADGDLEAYKAYETDSGTTIIVDMINRIVYDMNACEDGDVSIEWVLGNSKEISECGAKLLERINER